MYNFDPYNVLLSIATNIPVLLMTAFVLQCTTYMALQRITKYLVITVVFCSKSVEHHVCVLCCFVRELLSSDAMKDFNRARVYLDKNYNSQEQFTVSPSELFVSVVSGCRWTVEPLGGAHAFRSDMYCRYKWPVTSFCSLFYTFNNSMYEHMNDICLLDICTTYFSHLSRSF